MVRTKIINIKELGFNEFAEKPVVDVETIDAIDRGRNISQLRPSMVGIFYQDKVIQVVLENIENINEFKEIIVKELDKLPQPFLAFNKNFDQSVILGFTGKSYSFKEVQEFKYQKKQDAKLQNNIDVPDPFHGDGLQAIHFYKEYLATKNKKPLNLVVQHNQACLITEHLLYKLKNKNKMKNSVEETLNNVFNKRLMVNVVYPSSGLEWRKIEIYEIKNGFVNAFCHLKREMRKFRVNNIQNVQITDENYQIPADFPKMSFY